MPVVVANDFICRVAFVDDQAPDPERPVQAIGLTECVSFRFGFPNDEVLAGHPLWERGLDGYGPYLVTASPWLEEVRSIERTHERSAAVPFERHRHFFFVFHDSTFEAIAAGILPMSRYRTVSDALAAFAAEASRWAESSP
jgi:hypothetical protein